MRTDITVSTICTSLSLMLIRPTFSHRFMDFTTNSLYFLFGSIGSHPMLRPGRVCYTIQTAGVLSSFPGILDEQDKNSSITPEHPQ